MEQQTMAWLVLVAAFLMAYLAISFVVGIVTDTQHRKKVGNVSPTSGLGMLLSGAYHFTRALFVLVSVLAIVYLLNEFLELIRWSIAVILMTSN